MNQIEQNIKVLNACHFSTIKKILNRYSYLFTTFKEATVKQDMEECFDAVFSFPEVKIPIRIRKNSYTKYMDLTIRSKTKYNNKTEIHKLMEGFGNYYFYSWTDSSDLKISRYMILDLNIFRNTIIDKPDNKMDNSDGTGFYTYDFIKLVRADVVVLYEKLFNIGSFHILS